MQNVQMHVMDTENVPVMICVFVIATGNPVTVARVSAIILNNCVYAN